MIVYSYDITGGSLFLIGTGILSITDVYTSRGRKLMVFIASLKNVSVIKFFDLA